MKSTKRLRLLTALFLIAAVISTMLPVTTKAAGIPVSISLPKAASVTVDSKLDLETKTNVPSTLSYHIDKGSSYGSFKKNVFSAKKIGKIKVTVKATPTNANFYQTSTKVITISILPKVPTKIALTRFNGNKSGRVSFAKVQGATGYQVQYSKDPDFSTNVKNKYFSGTSYTFKTEKTKSYYVRLRSFARFGSKKNAYTLYSHWATGKLSPAKEPDKKPTVAPKKEPTTVYLAASTKGQKVRTYHKVKNCRHMNGKNATV